MKPVAWMSQGGDVTRNKDYFDGMGFKDLIPLYTAPRELSDKEIYEIWEEFNGEIKNFARAILKKASEK